MNGHEKGAEYERTLARLLSNWLTLGKSDKELWRSIGSGAHAGRFGKKQGGDIASISTAFPLVIQFCERFFIEAKHYKKLDWAGLLVHDTGELRDFWWKAVREAQMCGKVPILIVKENRRKAVVIVYNPQGHPSLSFYSLHSMLQQPPESFLGRIYEQACDQQAVS